MGGILRRISIVFAAGCLGGIINSLALWMAGARGITQVLGVAIVPHWSVAWLYPRVTWGGIWGFIFLLPILTKSPLLRGFLFSLAPSLVQLLFIYPYHTPYGNLGLALGTLTPAVVVAANAFWGVTASLWVRATTSGRN